MKKKKLIIFIAIVLLITAAIFVAIFLAKSNTEKKKQDKENNYTLKFDYMEDTSLIQRVTFIYSDKKLKDVTITLYFDSKETAKNSMKIYKAANEFKDYKVEKNTLILYYKDSDIIDYKTYTKDQIIQEYTEMGYFQKP